MKRKTSRFTTADITLNTSMLLGACGDAWTLTAMGDGLDVIDHRPYADGARTPVGLCADAPLLVLYPERGAVEWPLLLNSTPLRPGRLFSGASIWVVYLVAAEDARLRTEKTITLADIVLLMAQDAAAFAYWQKAFPLKDF